MRVQIRAGRTQDTVERILSGEVDMALVTNPVEHPRLISIPLADDPVVLVGAPELVNTLPIPLALSDLAEVEIISYQSPSRFRTFVDGVLEQHGVYLNTGTEFDSHEAVKTMVALAFGLAFVLASAVQKEVERGDLVIVPVEKLPSFGRTTSLLLRRGQDYKSPAALNMEQMILNHFGLHEV